MSERTRRTSRSLRWRWTVAALVALVAGTAGTPLAGAAAPAAATTTTLTAGGTLAPGAALSGPRYTLTMQSDGNLVETWLGHVVWGAKTWGHPGATASMQRDGNFVVYYQGRPIWGTHTWSTTLSSSWQVTLEDTGHLLFSLNGPRTTYRLHGSGVMISPAMTTSFNGDAPDPTVVASAGTYYAFSTGTALGNNLQVLVASSPTGPFHSYNGLTYGSSALPVAPSWERAGTQNSPSVIYFNGRWRMFYDAYKAGTAFGGGQVCISEATATTLSPGAPVFTDTSTGPIVCQPWLGGSLDPSATVNPTTGAAYLSWKTNDGSMAIASQLFTAQLLASGDRIDGYTATSIWYNNTTLFPWETTLDNPDLVVANGRWIGIFSVGDWQGASYAQAYLTCASPLGPCWQPLGVAPFLSQTAGAPPGGLGPAGGSLFDVPGDGWYLSYVAWGGGTSGCTRYSCGAVRKLYIAPIDLGG